MKIYQKILQQIQGNQNMNTRWSASYCGTDNIYYGLTAKQMIFILQNNWPEIKNLDSKTWVQLLDLLYSGKSYEEKAMAGRILAKSKQQRLSLHLVDLDRWLDNLSGWAEVDGTCQSTFTENELLSRWGEWHKFLLKLNKDNNINKQRASLVLPIKTLRTTTDDRVVKLAFNNVKNLMHKKEILITKAISWTLREMVKQHKQQISDFVDKYQGKLPKIVVREVKRKILTGRK